MPINDGDIARSQKPTLTEVLLFLRYDQTDSPEYKPEEYICEDFALQLQKNGIAAGYDFYRVRVNFSNAVGHMFNAIDTLDKGTVYIEPQDDLPYEKPQIGGFICYNKNFWDLNNVDISCFENEDFIITEIYEYHTP